ncbi:MAG: amidohydrolase [Actinomycetales bacterium mxb001]|nr:MAG: amidohydrolase [Actinomycetales bacterium mxb001]
MLSSTSCCNPKELAHAKLATAMASAPDQITPANHEASRPSGATADLLVVGDIVTNDPGAPTAQAMAISGSRIIGIGSTSDVEGLVTASTTTLKPGGFILPGLIDPHMHIWTSLLTYPDNDLSHELCPTLDDATATIKAAVAKAPSGQPVCFKNFDPSLYPGEPVLTRSILDQLAPNNPVLVWNASGHFMYVNSLMFQAAGITDETPDPPGGTFERADGKMTGVVGEPPAEQLILKGLPQPSMADITMYIRQILTACAAQGVTSVREAATGALAGPKELALLHQLNAQARFPVRVSTAQFAVLPGKTPVEVAAMWKAAGVTPFSGDEMLRADAWKVVSDGSNQGRSGYFLQPYLGEDNGGKSDYTPETLRQALKAGLDDGWQVMVHTNGDAAVEFVLEAMEEILPAYGNHDLRHRFEHCSFTMDDQLTRMAAAGISPSFLMNHLYYWGAAFRDTILGPKRAGRLDRVASAYKAGLRPSLHSDYNVTEVHPLLSARTAVLRRTKADDQVLNAAECATPEQALAAITTNAAWQIHADDRGVLKVGNAADFGVADGNPWASDPSGWADIAFQATYVGGEEAWHG